MKTVAKFLVDSFIEAITETTGITNENHDEEYDLYVCRIDAQENYGFLVQGVGGTKPEAFHDAITAAFVMVLDNEA